MNRKKSVTKKNGKRLSAADKRVLLAQDVLHLLAEKKISVEQGIYCTFPDSVPKQMMEEGSDVKEVISSFRKPCQVCGVGSLFVAKVLRDDKLPINKNQLCYGIVVISKKGVLPEGQSFMGSPVFEYLNKNFSQRQLRLIEYAFEGENKSPFNFWKEEDRITKFRSKSKGTKNKLISIMKNIITNKGEFVP